jgi:hypothetical protein
MGAEGVQGVAEPDIGMLFRRMTRNTILEGAPIYLGESFHSEAG